MDKNTKIDFELNDEFEGGYTLEEKDGVSYIHFSVKSTSGEPEKPKVSVHWDSPIVGSNVFWQPYFNHNKYMLVNWSVRHEACGTVSAPVVANVGYDDMNGITIASSDCENRIEMKSCVVEVNANYDNRLTFDVQKKVVEYSASIRIDERRLPFYEVIGDVGDWWRDECGYREPYIPEDSFGVVYSTWYAFLQNLTAAEVEEECRHFAALGVKTVIIDDGWQGPGDQTPMNTNGDWRICEEKFPDMKAFVDTLHSLGIKVMLWFPLSYLGRDTDAFATYGTYGTFNPWSDSFITIDPRYPEMRKYLVETYTRVMRDWSLDGLKLDYIDAQAPNREYKDGMDYESVFDATKKLLEDITTAVKAINPEAMFEFRQNYTGPVMHEYGTMFRVSDCPEDSFANRANSIGMRLLGGKSAIHSDMVMWNEKESAEDAAYQLTNALFCVPQISVRWNETSEEQKNMMRFYIPFIDENREVLLHGDLRAKGLAADYTFVSAAKGTKEISAIYMGKVAEIRSGMDDVTIVNATAESELYIECADKAVYGYVVKNCYGEVVSEGKADFESGFVKLPCTENGMIVMKS